MVKKASSILMLFCAAGREEAGKECRARNHAGGVACARRPRRRCGVWRGGASLQSTPSGRCMRGRPVAPFHPPAIQCGARARGLGVRNDCSYLGGCLEEADAELPCELLAALRAHTPLADQLATRVRLVAEQNLKAGEGEVPP